MIEKWGSHSHFVDCFATVNPDTIYPLTHFRLPEMFDDCIPSGMNVNVCSIF